LRPPSTREAQQKRGGEGRGEERESRKTQKTKKQVCVRPRRQTGRGRPGAVAQEHRRAGSSADVRAPPLKRRGRERRRERRRLSLLSLSPFLRLLGSLLESGERKSGTPAGPRRPHAPRAGPFDAALDRSDPGAPQYAARADPDAPADGRERSAREPGTPFSLSLPSPPSLARPFSPPADASACPEPARAHVDDPLPPPHCPTP
jgi:hypothetical protein